VMKNRVGERGYILPDASHLDHPFSSVAVGVVDAGLVTDKVAARRHLHLQQRSVAADVVERTLAQQVAGAVGGGVLGNARKVF